MQHKFDRSATAAVIGLSRDSVQLVSSLQWVGRTHESEPRAVLTSSSLLDLRHSTKPTLIHLVLKVSVAGS